MDDDEEPEYREAINAIPKQLDVVSIRNLGVDHKRAKELAEVVGKHDEDPQWTLTNMVRDANDPSILARERSEEADLLENGVATSLHPNVMSIKIKLTKNKLAVVGLTTDPEDDLTFPHGYGLAMSESGLSRCDNLDMPEEQQKWDGDTDELTLVISHGHMEFHRSGKKVGELGPVTAQSMYAKIAIIQVELRVFVRDVRTCTAVSAIDLNKNRIGDAGAKDLAMALRKKGSKVEKLDLGLNAIRDDGAMALAESLPAVDCRVRVLNLSHNVIGDQGVSALAEALMQDSCLVADLDLTDNNIGDVGAVMIAEAIEKESCALTSLKLGLNKIEGSGLIKIAEALEKQTCGITHITLMGNRATKESKRRLARAFASTPRLDVV
jgi:hypothetical protein